MRIKIPAEYFSAFNWINKQPDSGRIANFPSSSYAGWEVYRWGFQGAGFFWFGEKMPFLARDFDRWIPYNENYYHEMSYAVYSRNKDLFENLLKKYQISLVLIDENIISQSTRKDFIYLEQLKEILKNSDKISLGASYGKLSLYKVDLGVNPQNYVSLASNLPVIGSEYQWNNYDQAFSDSGSYISNDNPKSTDKITTYYPFRSIFTGRKQSEFEFKLEDKGDYFSFSTNVPKTLVGAKLILPGIITEDVTEIDRADLTMTTPKYPEILLDGELVPYDPTQPNGNTINLLYIRSGLLEIRIPKIKGYFSFDSMTDSNISEKSPYNCGDFSAGQNQSEIVDDNGNKVLKMTSFDSSSCLDVPITNLSQRTGFLVTIENKNIDGESTFFSLINKSSEKSDIDTYLPDNQEMKQSYFVIPPMEQYGLGYSLFFKNTSIGQITSSNELGRITVNPIPYRFLTGLKIVKEQGNLQSITTTDGLVVEHPDPSFYQVSITSDKTGRLDNSTLVLSQSFNSGWKAYEITNSWWVDNWYTKLLIPLFGKNIDSHVLVNSWGSGWQSPAQTDNAKPTVIALVYLPQYLEYLGFALLGGLALYFLISQKRTSRKLG